MIPTKQNPRVIHSGPIKHLIIVL